MNRKVGRASRLTPAKYVLSVVGTSRCDVRAACSGATPSSVARMFVPPATTRAGTAQRTVPTIALNTYKGTDEKPNNQPDTVSVEHSATDFQ